MACDPGYFLDDKGKCVPITNFKVLLYQADKCDEAALVVNVRKGLADKLARLIDGNVTRRIFFKVTTGK